MIKYGLMLLWWIVVGFVCIVCVGVMYGRGVVGKLVGVGVVVSISMMMYGEYLKWREDEGLDDMYMSDEWLVELREYEEFRESVDERLRGEW